MSAPNIVLYEFTTKLPNSECISPYTATVRCALNYLNLPFRSQLCNFRDIQAVSIDLGLGPTTTYPDGSPKYTVPILVDTSSTAEKPTIIADSFAIVQYLDKTYASPDRPSMFTSIPSVDRLAASGITTAFMGGMISGALFRDAFNLLQDEDKPHMIQRNLGGFDPDSVPDISGTQAWDEAVEKAIQGTKSVTACVGEDGGWVGGDRMLFVDCVMLGMLNMIRLVNEEVWRKLIDRDGGKMRKYWDAGKEYVRFRSATSGST